jgi:hypothetical protein
MSRTWTIYEAGRAPRVVTLAEYVVALEQAARTHAKVQTYSLEAQPRDTGRPKGHRAP